jgi:CheY-like chemotaxis protein
MIQLLGCEVDIASNGREAIDRYLKNTYDLIFMDCQMPLVDGYEATREIRSFEKNNGLQPTPIIALTAGNTRKDEARCKLAGMEDYLTKPYSLSQLSNVLENFIGYRPSAQTRNHNATEPSKSGVEIAPGQDDTEVLNITALNNIREVEKQTGNKILPTLYDGFVSQMVEKLDELSADYQSRNHDSLYRTAHAIKSMSANIGAEKVKNISSHIESLGRNGDLQGIEELIVNLGDAYQEFLDAFKTDVLS